jgi:PTS system mannose-specific IIC component
VTLEFGVVAGLILWGAVVGLDLVSFPQALLSRPIVAGTVAGWITGDPAAGLRVGVMLELFALEVLPIGGSRYPDYGPATVAATAILSGAPWRDQLGVAGLVALGLALVGGRGIDLLRALNGARVRRAEAALAAGDPATLAQLQRLGLLSDLLRSALVTGLGLGAWAAVAALTGGGKEMGGGGAPAFGPVLTKVVVAGAVLAAASGLVRRGLHGGARWLACSGLLVGAVIAWRWI